MIHQFINLCPAFRQIGERKKVFLYLLLNSLQFKIILVLKWHILECHQGLPTVMDCP